MFFCHLSVWCSRSVFSCTLVRRHSSRGKYLKQASSHFWLWKEDRRKKSQTQAHTCTKWSRSISDKERFTKMLPLGPSAWLRELLPPALKYCTKLVKCSGSNRLWGTLVELNWLGLSRGYLYFHKCYSLMIFWTLKFIISLNQYIFLLLKSWYIIYSCIFSNVIFYVVYSNPSKKTWGPASASWPCLFQLHVLNYDAEFRIQTKNEDVSWTSSWPWRQFQFWQSSLIILKCLNWKIFSHMIMTLAINHFSHQSV